VRLSLLERKLTAHIGVLLDPISEHGLVALNRIKSKDDREVVTPRSPVVAHGRRMVFLKNRSQLGFLTCQKTEPRPNSRKESVETVNIVEEKTY
jgi:hypothetical protein